MKPNPSRSWKTADRGAFPLRLWELPPIADGDSSQSAAAPVPEPFPNRPCDMAVSVRAAETAQSMMAQIMEEVAEDQDTTDEPVLHLEGLGHLAGTDVRAALSFSSFPSSSSSFSASAAAAAATAAAVVITTTNSTISSHALSHPLGCSSRVRVLKC